VFVDSIAPILTRAALAFVLALAGGMVSVRAAVLHEQLCGLISMAAGTLLGVTLFSILPESFEAMRWWELAVAVGSGYAVFGLLSRYVFHVCPACAASHFDETTTQHFRKIAGALVVALAVHSTMDGVAVAAGHEAHGRLDLSVLVAVCTHKVPEGLALGALLVGAGFRGARVMMWVAAVESTTLAGAVLGLWGLRHVNEWWIAAVLAHAGGGFVFLAAHAVLGELVKHGKAVVLSAFVTGTVAIAVLNLLVRWL
jgi:ZIP family zinc transporter